MRVALVLLVLLSACAGRGVEVENLVVKSVFDDGKRIPDAYTCKGRNVSPPLSIAGIPDSARSLAIIMDDPDAPGGTFVHWLVWNIPPRETIPEGIPKGEKIASPFAANQGGTDFGDAGYGGPCPPPGKPHRYYFRVYALDSELDLLQADRDGLEDAMKGHVIVEGRLMGTYSR